MASSSGNGRDKGKRPLSEVLSCLLGCFTPEDSQDQDPNPSASAPPSDLPPASPSDSFPASSSGQGSTSAPQGNFRLVIDQQNFRKKLGEGRYGTVYEGLVMNSNKRNEGRHSNLMFGDSMVGSFDMWTRVALKVVNEEGMKVISNWLSEVRCHGNLDSPHFAKLIAITEYTRRKGEKATALIYDFMTNKSLKDCLFNEVPCRLTWDLRVKIALLAAEGLLYLHEGMETQMVYGEFKASKILLDVAFTPKLAFFGLSRSKEEPLSKFEADSLMAWFS